ncbi:Ubiquitin carboxyl-terminal hydrolase 21 [Podochytrium sp. JEL0797]|nr:Ubiquitin carboxyl-terminal hydrolase 21 [Podochytrium sp. JEL0797]
MIRTGSLAESVAKEAEREYYGFQGGSYGESKSHEAVEGIAAGVWSGSRSSGLKKLRSGLSLDENVGSYALAKVKDSEYPKIRRNEENTRKHRDGGPSGAEGTSADVGRRKSALHPEVEEILGMSLGLKQSGLLKYTLAKNPNSLRGLMGLVNLGNTCFMNSILQCIFSIEILMGYLQSPDFEREVNPAGPMKGRLATAFAKMALSFLSTPTTPASAITPSRFKQHLDQHAPQFKGYQQHDAQEFLRVLLDVLHEEVNRVGGGRRRFTYKDKDVDVLG